MAPTDAIHLIRRNDTFWDVSKEIAVPTLFEGEEEIIDMEAALLEGEDNGYLTFERFNGRK